MKAALLLLAVLFAFVPGELRAASPQPAICLNKFVAPNYSVIARLARVQGTVQLDVEYNAKGEPEQVGPPAIGGGQAILQEAAINAVKAWKFCPSTSGPNHNRIVVTFDSRLTLPGVKGWAPTTVSLGPPATVGVATEAELATLQQ
jgi:TonB family protein